MKKMLPLLLLVSVIQSSIAQFSVQPNQYRFRYTVPKGKASYVEAQTVITHTSETLKAGTVIERKAELQSSNGIISVSIHERLAKDSVVQVAKTTIQKNVKTHPDEFYSAIKQVKDSLFFNPWTNNTAAQRNVEYFYKLENRRVPVTFRFATNEIGALTIPFKYRYSFRRGGTKVPDEFVPDFNVGIFISRTWGKQTFFYWKNQEDRSPRTRCVNSLGAFLGISTTKLDSANTSLSKEYLKGEKTIAMFSPGFGYVHKIAGVGIGLLVGLDFPVGATGRKWNYRDKPWIGFGIGYNTTFLPSFKQ
jgi:hypothetical protein